MALNTQPYKGARDFYPEAKRQQAYIFNIWRQQAERFGYEEYDAPIIEPLEIYLAKTSEEIVNEQTYVFEDRGGRKVTLRPEMTPTVSRMVAGRRQSLAYPLRWFSIPNLWRYERPQHGRLREHWQLNVDLFGIAGVEGDHELIALADAIMQRFGAVSSMYAIRLNSRELMDYIFEHYLNCDRSTALQLMRLIDKMHKMSTTDFRTAVSTILAAKADDLLTLLKVTDLDSLPLAIRNQAAAKRLRQLEVMLLSSGIKNASFDISLVRGFDYYTDIVFELYDTDPANKRSLFGGGRYDGLVGAFGVEPIPTVGFGMGDVTLQDFLTIHHLLPDLTTTVDVDVILIGDVYVAAQALCQTLRRAGLNVAVDSSHRKMDKQLKNALKANYRYVLFVGEQELADGQYNLKDLTTGQEQRLTLNQLQKQLTKIN